jgi:hypothetical protein
MARLGGSREGLSKAGFCEPLWWEDGSLPAPLTAVPGHPRERPHAWQVLHLLFTASLTTNETTED